MKNQFLLDQSIIYLNHGSFGACPKPIFEDYQKWQLELERQPVEFITKTGPLALKQSKLALANYINCDADDLVYTPNPSVAGNTVIKSLRLGANDEVLTTNHEYGAMDRTWKYYCQKAGAKYIQQNISLPLASKEQFIEAFWKGLTSKTKIIFISQITSSTGLIFPVKEICKRAKELGLMTIVDGAHVPAHIDLDLKELDADIYFGACHKWMLTPKGSSFLYVKRALQNLFDPLIISWGYDAEFPSHSQFLDYHEFNGTRDFSAYLTIPVALEFLKKNNWEEEKKKCKTMIREVYPEASKILGTQPICPLTDEFLGQMCSIPVNTANPIELKNLLYDKYRIEIPVMKSSASFMQRPNQIFIRISLQAYNSMSDVEKLFEALKDIKSKTNLIF